MNRFRPSANLVWLTYRGVWGFVGTLSWTTAAVYFVRDVGMSPLELVLAGTALEIAYFLFEVPPGSSPTCTRAGSPSSFQPSSPAPP